MLQTKVVRVRGMDWERESLNGPYSTRWANVSV